MKTTKDIKKEISDISSMAMKDPDHDYTKELRRFRWLEMYLETMPNEAFLTQTLQNHRNDLEVIEKKYQDWLNCTPEAQLLKNPRAKYNNIMGSLIIKNQIKNLEYILS